MKILVLGGGGREHALVWALHRGKHDVHAAPGNPGMEDLATLHPEIALENNSVLALAQSMDPDLIVIGPEAPLVAGMADDLRCHGFRVFGPGASGARLEGSKAFAKSFMARHAIPTAPFAVCTTLEEAFSALDGRHAPFVIKADGLASGKGVFVAECREKADAICRELLTHRSLGDAGSVVLVEDFLPGWEMTVLALCDGHIGCMLPPSQDHKRIGDHDVGANTGGMGAYTPVPQADGRLLRKIQERILEPTVRGLASEGIPFSGVLYVGIMVVNGDPYVVEFNVRFGDPEAQVVLPALSVEWGALFLACAEGRLEEMTFPTPGCIRAAAGIVLASEGYPGTFERGKPIDGLGQGNEREDLLVFHAGTKRTPSGEVVTDGGRVLTVVGLGNSLDEALGKAYEGVGGFSFQGMYFRRDIGAQALRHRPAVGIILGSVSDQAVAREAAEIFRALEIPFEVTVASAHRTPEDVVQYAASAQRRGIRVIIAVAGLSAALPGVIAAHTELPVLGVPVASGSLGGIDALLSVAQMPPGVPVGSLGIGGGRNAALLATRILGTSCPTIARRLSAWGRKAAEKVVASREKLEDLPSPSVEAFAARDQACGAKD